MLLGIGVSAFASKIVTDSIYSKTLNFTHKYNVYLPDGYDKGDQKYPVVYLFHGMYGGYSDWVKMKRFFGNIAFIWAIISLVSSVGTNTLSKSLAGNLWQLETTNSVPLSL